MRPERLSLQQTNPRSGATVSVTSTFSDFREVSGVTVPFTSKTVQSTSKGERTITSTTQEPEINVDPEDDSSPSTIRPPNRPRIDREPSER